jgi:phosphatidate phosphatase PAH1
MADNEHRMLFDIRGRRKNVVKVVYAVLAILMGASLFVAVGPFNIGELFNQQTTGDAAEPYEEQAERVEARLKKDPENPALLLTLTRAHVNAGNAQYQEESNGEKVMTVESYQEFQEASDSWNSYLEATEEPPNPALAQLMAFTLVQLAENSRSFTETQNNIAAATEAQEIVAKQRPTLNSLSTLALYSYFDGDVAAAEKARAEASKLANSKAERDQLDKSLDETKKRAEKFQQEVQRAERQSKAQGGAGGGESLENPLGGGGLSGGGLGE